MFESSPISERSKVFSLLSKSFTPPGPVPTTSVVELGSREDGEQRCHGKRNMVGHERMPSCL